MAMPTAHSGPKSLSAAAAGAAPAKLDSPLNNDSLELASTSSVSLRTTVGTRALRASWYAFWPTSTQRASRKKLVPAPSIWKISR